MLSLVKTKFYLYITNNNGLLPLEQDNLVTKKGTLQGHHLSSGGASLQVFRTRDPGRSRVEYGERVTPSHQAWGLGKFLDFCF